MHYVPQHVFDTHEAICNDILSDENISVKTKLIFPEKTVDCPNCIFDSFHGKSSGRYQTGGPIEFTGGICPYCNNAGILKTPQSDIINLRVYYDKASWRKIANIEIDSGDAFCIGYIKDLIKIRQATDIIPSYEIKEYGENVYVLAGSPVPWGLSKDKFFAAALTRK